MDGNIVNIILNRTPSQQELQKAASTLRSKLDNVVILSWNEGGNVQTLSVQCNLPKDGIAGPDFVIPEPTWTLRSGEQARWTHSTSDLGLILCLLTSGPEMGMAAPGLAAQPLARELQEVQISHQPPPMPQPLSPRQSIFRQEAISANPYSPPDAAAQARQQAISATVMLAGDIAQVDLASVLQSIVLCQMSGCLSVANKTQGIDVFFLDGSLLDARMETIVLGQQCTEFHGEQAVLELLTWDEGHFEFQHGRTTRTRTVKRRFEALLMEGSALRDYWRYLVEQGLDQPDSVFMATDSTISEIEFEARLNEGLPLDARTQRQLYLALIEGEPLSNVLSSMNLQKPRWVPMIFNLLTSNLLAPGKRGGVNTRRKVAQVSIDWQQVKAAADDLCRPDTHIFGQQLFLYFVDLEMARACSIGAPFSITIFELRIPNPEVVEGPTLLMVQTLSDILRSIIDPFALLGHFELLDIAMLLPHKSKEETEAIVLEALTEFTKAIKRGPDNPVIITYGISTFPDDNAEIEPLLSHAKTSKKPFT